MWIALPSLWLITNISAVQEEAWKWISFDLSLEQVLTRHWAFGGTPPLRSVVRYAPVPELGVPPMDRALRTHDLQRMAFRLSAPR